MKERLSSRPGFEHIDTMDYYQEVQWLHQRTADVYTLMGDYENAEAEMEEARKVYSEYHRLNLQTKDPPTLPESVFFRDEIHEVKADWLIAQGRTDEAVELVTPVLERMRKLYPKGDYFANEYIYNMAYCYYYDGQFDKAHELLEEIVGVNRGEFISDLMEVANCYHYLALIAEKQGKFPLAGQHYEKALELIRKNRMRSCKVELADALNPYAEFELRRGQYPAARKLFEESIPLRLETQGPLQPNYADSLRGLAEIGMAEGNYTSATLKAKQALEIFDKALVEDHPRKASVYALLASLELLQDKTAFADSPNFKRFLAITGKNMGRYQEPLAQDLQRYAKILSAAGHAEEGRQLTLDNQPEQIPQPAAKTQ